MVNKKIGLIETCIYAKLKTQSRDGLIKRKKVLYLLGSIYHIPKELRNLIIKELEEKGLIKVLNKKTIKIK